MKVFIHGIDSPLGHNLSRIFARSKPGAIARNGEEEQQQQQNATGEELDENGHSRVVQNYQVVGTFVKEPPKYSISHPGQMHYSGKPKRDARRKEAIEKFNVYGQKPEWVDYIIDNNDKNRIKQEMFESEIIIFDVIQHHDAQWAIEELAQAQSNFVNQKLFIGISSILTWTRTVTDPDDPEFHFTEQEYKRRRAHIDYRPHLEVERHIMKLGKRENLKSFIVNIGLLLHPGDHFLHRMFKDAWQSNSVKISGNGENVIPLAHIDDVTNAILYVAETKSTQRYMLVVDEANNTIAEIAKSVSAELGIGKTETEEVGNLLLDQRVTKFEYDLLRVNIRMLPGQIKELGFEVKYVNGMIENMKKLVQEYKDARGFHPVKIMVYGPPGVGKSGIAQTLGRLYDIPVFGSESVMAQTIAHFEEKIASESEEDVHDARKALEEITEARNANNNEFSREHIIKYVRQRILKKDSINQGYVFDGCDFTQEEFIEIFKPEEDGNDDDETEGDPVDYNLAPEFIVVVDASDDFIYKRVMSLTETELSEGQFLEETFMKRLSNYRNNNTEDKTILNYFDEIEIHPKILNAEEPTETVVSKIEEFVGQPRNYGLSYEEQLEKNRIEQEEKKAAEEQESQRKTAEEREELLRKQKEAVELEQKLMQIREQEQQAVEAQSIPLRQYLMKHVMPTLTAGLVEVSKVRPEDPIDYLAEYLFTTQLNKGKHGAHN